ncbi:hypothetical protein LQZ19_08020 [Treponema primitia]|uniref:hypothetical protein n=1 Tax=Treponema primitia TaxID=88058 RepID=UPI00398157E9
MLLEDVADFPSFIFKFRPYTPLAIKELKYGELYFSDFAELNDPYDTRLCLIFKPNQENYEEIIRRALSSMPQEKIDITEMASFLARTEKTYGELIATLKSNEFATIAASVIKIDSTLETIFYMQQIIEKPILFIHASVHIFVYVCSFTRDIITQ